MPVAALKARNNPAPLLFGNRPAQSKQSVQGVFMSKNIKTSRSEFL
jgi:hypothetical protein